MLLARAGHSVLLLDRATFPSDKLSTHYIQPPGIEALERWGLLDAIIATNCPELKTFSVYMGDTLVMEPPMTASAYCPRRHLLDKILVDAAVEAGVELRQGVKVEQVVTEDGAVTGIVGRDRAGRIHREDARFVIGAEGHHSLVADTVGAEKYREREALTGGYYSYFSGTGITDAQVHISDDGGVLAFPTNDGQVCIAAGLPRDRFHEYRADIEGTFYRILDASPGFAARVRAGKRDERWQGTADLPNFFRKPWGPGWALVGDAGYMKDPITGFGIADAFRDAELLASALDEVLSGRQAPEVALAAYQEQRDAAAIPVYEFTLQLASGELSFATAAGQGAPAG
jgi:flavin-dependent dehydrogenase